jgi:hypothetical protein
MRDSIERCHAKPTEYPEQVPQKGVQFGVALPQLEAVAEESAWPSQSPIGRLGRERRAALGHPHSWRTACQHGGQSGDKERGESFMKN